MCMTRLLLNCIHQLLHCLPTTSVLWLVKMNIVWFNICVPLLPFATLVFIVPHVFHVFLCCVHILVSFIIVFHDDFSHCNEPKQLVSINFKLTFHTLKDLLKCTLLNPLLIAHFSLLILRKYCSIFNTYNHLKAILITVRIHTGTAGKGTRPTQYPSIPCLSIQISLHQKNETQEVHLQHCFEHLHSLNCSLPLENELVVKNTHLSLRLHPHTS